MSLYLAFWRFWIFFKVSGFKGELQMKSPQKLSPHSATSLSLFLLSIFDKSSRFTYLEAKANNLYPCFV